MHNIDLSQTVLMRSMSPKTPDRLQSHLPLLTMSNSSRNPSLHGSPITSSAKNDSFRLQRHSSQQPTLRVIMPLNPSICSDCNQHPAIEASSWYRSGKTPATTM